MHPEHWLRYVIPGYIVLAPVLVIGAYIARNELTEKETLSLLAAFAATGPAAGFALHQWHMLLHEKMYNSCRRKRPIINLIINEWEDKATKHEATDFDAFLAWDCFFTTPAMKRRSIMASRRRNITAMCLMPGSRTT
jgi:hypothetical protein